MLTESRFSGQGFGGFIWFPTLLVFNTFMFLIDEHLGGQKGSIRVFEKVCKGSAQSGSICLLLGSDLRKYSTFLVF